MKHLLNISLALVMSIGTCFAQLNISITPNPIYTTVEILIFSNPPTFAWQNSTAKKIGFISQTDASYVWRSLNKISLSTIPSDAIITQAKLRSWVTNYSINDPNYRAITKLMPSRINSLMNSSTNVDTLRWRFSVQDSVQNFIVQRYTDTLETNVLTEVNINRTIGYLIFGGRSLQEGGANSDGLLQLELKITYYQPFPVTFENNFPGGSMNINTVLVQDLPYVKPGVRVGDAFSLGAIAQTDNAGYARVWNDYAPVNRSNWTKVRYRLTTERSPNVNYSFNAAADDSGATYKANLRRRFNISRNDQLELDGTIAVGIVGQAVEQNSITVTAPIQQIINNRDYRFSRWSDGTTNPSLTFVPADNTILTAEYKVHRYSNSPTGTATNNQRKIAQGNEFCMVYQSGDRVWFSKSSDGVNWSNDFPLSDGSWGTINKYPSILVAGNRVNVVWQSIQWNGWFDDGCVIYLRGYDISTNAWGPLEQVAAFWVDQENFLATAVIDGSLHPYGPPYDVKRIAWKETDGIKVIDNNYGSWGTIGTVSGTNGASYYPSIANYNGDHYALCWEDASAEAINYTESFYNTGNGTWSFNNSQQVSPNGWYTNQRPSMSVGSQTGSCTARKVSVAWQSVGNVVEGVSVHVRQANFGCNNWGNITSYSMITGGTPPHPVIGSYDANANLSLVWNEQTNVYVAKYNGVCWFGPYLIATGNDGGAECNINVATPASLAAIWRKPSGAIAVTGITPPPDCAGQAEEESIVQDDPKMMEPLTRVATRHNRHGLVQIAHAVGVNNKRFKGDLAFEIAGMKLVTLQGAKDIPFENLEALPNGRSELSSKPFTVSDPNSRLVFAGAVYGKKIFIPADSLRTINQPLALVTVRENRNGQGRKQVWHLPFSALEATRDSSFGVFKEFTIDVSDLVGKELYIEVEMLGRVRQVAPLIDDDYLILSSGSQSLLANGSLGTSVENTIPMSYALYQNYPNPFNPVTTFRFDLPEAQEISLKVFNILGQEVMTVAQGLREAGEHSVTADFTNLSSGMYIYRMSAGKFNDVKKLILIR